MTRTKGSVNKSISTRLCKKTREPIHEGCGGRLKRAAGGDYRCRTCGAEVYVGEWGGGSVSALIREMCR